MKDSKTLEDSKASGKAGARTNRRDAIKAVLGTAAAVGLTQLPTSAIASSAGGSTKLEKLDDMAAKPSSLDMPPRLTYLGGPTYLIEIGSFRIISDPGFDPQGTERNEGPGHLLTKVMEPPIPVDEIGPIDVALVSHAQHLDNLDNEGRRLLDKVGMTLTTPESAEQHLPGKKAVGLPTWKSKEVTNAAGERLTITATPGVHTSNPDLRPIVGEVTGFMLEWQGRKRSAFYISGDTVWIDEINEIAKRYDVSAAILHLGAANVPAVGDNFLTMSSSDGVRAAKALKLDAVYPAHFEGWRHFTQGAWYIERDFEKAGLAASLHMMRPGEAENVAI